MRLILALLLLHSAWAFGAEEYSLRFEKTGRLTCIVKADGSIIPIAPGNRLFEEFKEWNKKQQTPLVLQDRAPDPPTAEELAAAAKRDQDAADRATIKAFRLKPRAERTAADREAALEAMIRLLE